MHAMHRRMQAGMSTHTIDMPMDTSQQCTHSPTMNQVEAEVIF